MEEKEMLKVYDSNLKYIADVERGEVHQKELLHEVVHCWIVDIQNEEPWIYLQQRSFNKAEFAGLYDISVAGHVSTGEDAELSAIREMEEEVGLRIDQKDLKYLGYVVEHLKCSGYYDNEICQVFIYKTDIDLNLKVSDEVEKIVKIPFSEYKGWILEEKDEIWGISINDGVKIEIKSKDMCRHSKEAAEILMKELN